MSRKPLTKRRMIFFSILTLLLVLGVVEAALRIAGFSFERPAADHAMVVDLSNEAVQKVLLKRDPLYIWHISPLANYQGRTVNNLGFLDEHRSLDKPTGMIRVLCLGDSCTADGEPPYTKLLEDSLNGDRPADSLNKQFEVINAGVWSYSSAQGFALANDLIPALNPDIVTIYYGLNDHTLTSSGLTDAEVFKKLRDERTAPNEQPQRLPWIGQLRMYQATNAAIHAVQQNRLIASIHRENRVRVPLDQYQFNLEQIIAIARRNGAVPVLVTFPQNFNPGGAMDFFAEHHILVDYETFSADHQRYVEATREVAARTRTPLVDLEGAFPPERDPLFISDGIHHTHAGRELIVDLMAATIREIVSEQLTEK